MLVSGSSPRLRGTWHQRPRAIRTHGIIPALAGNIDGSRLREWCRGDHPRACGEHLPYLGEKGAHQGSSPRLRGTCGDLDEIHVLPGIIPALAGNIATWQSHHHATRDHPRACGEHSYPVVCSRCLCGIIPALAGNIRRPSSASNTTGDHPRACGEHCGGGHRPVAQVGSSPRLRGTCHEAFTLLGARGIIPALAGNITCTRCSVERRWDHPRACGEHSNPHLFTANGSGSSPRLRGTFCGRVG